MTSADDGTFWVRDAGTLPELAASLQNRLTDLDDSVTPRLPCIPLRLGPALYEPSSGRSHRQQAVPGFRLCVRMPAARLLPCTFS